MDFSNQMGIFDQLKHRQKNRLPMTNVSQVNLSDICSKRVYSSRLMVSGIEQNCAGMLLKTDYSVG